jgi:glycosyltransferase involved in cell wall biosynthesis
VDFKRFETANESSRDELRQKLKFNGRRVITYVGSFDGWYLTDEILNFLEAARTEDISTFALILTQRDTEKVILRLKEKGFSEKDFWVASVAPSDIPMYLGASDIALSFIKQCYSKQASSPTKIAEYLASGLPVISNRGIGDLDELIETDEVGILVEEFTPANFAQCLNEMTALKKQEDLINRCKISAKKRFDLIKVGGARYRSLYNKLLSRN